MLPRRNHLVVALLLVFVSSPAFAQPDPSGRFEVFAGYSILQTNYDPDSASLPSEPVVVLFDGHQHLNGLDVSLTRYWAGQFGLTGDASWHFTTNRVADPLGGSITTKVRIASVSGGPQFQLLTHPRFTSFVRALVGVTQTWAQLDVPSIDARGSQSSTDFAWTIGGGADVRVGDRIRVRVFQGDYSRIFLPRRNTFGFARRPHNVRFSFGVVMNNP